MSEFWNAEQDIIDEANNLIANYHPELSGAEIAYVFKDAASASEIESGQVCIAKKITGLNKALSKDDVDFAIVIASDLYNGLSDTQREAMLDSALTCCTVKTGEDGEEKLDKSGKPIWVIRPHDIIAHASIIQRYGLDVLKDAGDCIKASVEVPKDTKALDESEYDDGEVNEQPVSDGGAKKARRTKAKG